MTTRLFRDLRDHPRGDLGGPARASEILVDKVCRAGVEDLVRAVAGKVGSHAMPTLAMIDGIRITMYYADHEPAHFHAIAGEAEIVLTIADMRVIAGRAPPAVIRRVRAWARRHRSELALCWVRCRAGQKPGRIEE